jgi:hypothetical protein
VIAAVNDVAVGVSLATLFIGTVVLGVRALFALERDVAKLHDRVSRLEGWRNGAGQGGDD